MVISEGLEAETQGIWNQEWLYWRGPAELLANRPACVPSSLAITAVL
jgi:hypothetical protein